jgi:hypothetical protein
MVLENFRCLLSEESSENKFDIKLAQCKQSSTFVVVLPYKKTKLALFGQKDEKDGLGNWPISYVLETNK